MNALPSNSSITVDGHTINAHASIVMLWEAVIAGAIEAGHAHWIRVNDGSGMRGYLVHASTTVSSYISNDDLGEQSSDLTTDNATNSNLGSWVDMYIDRDSETWHLAESIGLDKEIDAIAATRSD